MGLKLNAMINIQQFVKDSIETITSYQSDNKENVKHIVKSALKTFPLKSHEQTEVVANQEVVIIYLHSIMEENILTKIVQEASENMENLDIEALYEGRVIRNY
ncbi:DUF6407 family protein [Bacillus alkalicellulosilyticus]|uniref:DUF6407 family protein n=1 Tax=Alkalihalobacterium alkalicellulosilyticum TaxID=1912214 RepID=UPI000997E642|nr:DUF6407 family protein [Bacillus alkalicellulosilyticus]